MTLPTFTDKTDGVDDVVSADINAVFAALRIIAPATPAADWVNAESLTGNKTLVDADLPVQSLSPTAARDVTMPVLDNSNHAFWIINRSGTYALTIKNSGGTGIGTISAGISALWVSDGANAWYNITNPTTAQITALLPAASDTVSGIVELAIASEINTGTDAGRAVTPDALAGSNLGTKNVQLVVIAPATALTTGDNKIVFVVPPELNGMNLVDADGALTGVVATGATLPLIQVRNATDSVDMLSTRITIDDSEWTSFTAAAPPVIDATKDDVVTGDRLAIDIDAIGNTTPGTGLNVLLSFRLP